MVEAWTSNLVIGEIGESLDLQHLSISMPWSISNYQQEVQNFLVGKN